MLKTLIAATAALLVATTAFAQLAPRFALHFCPLIVDNHRGHPSLIPSRLGL